MKNRHGSEGSQTVTVTLRVSAVGWVIFVVLLLALGAVVAWRMIDNRQKMQDNDRPTPTTQRDL